RQAADLAVDDCQPVDDLGAAVLPPGRVAVGRSQQGTHQQLQRSERGPQLMGGDGEKLVAGLYRLKHLAVEEIPLGLGPTTLPFRRLPQLLLSALGVEQQRPLLLEPTALALEPREHSN